MLKQKKKKQTRFGRVCTAKPQQELCPQPGGLSIAGTAMARSVANAKWHRPRHRASAQCWESSGRDRSPQHWGAATAFVIHQRNGWQTSPQGWRGRGCRAAQGHCQLWEGCVCTPLGVPGGGRLQLFKIKRSLKWILVADGRSLVDKLHSSVFPSELLLTLTSVHRDSRVASSE